MKEGKSHVVKTVIKDELFDQILHWRQGLDYQVVALQAVMADLLDGDTLHHACGIPVRKKGRGLAHLKCSPSDPSQVPIPLRGIRLVCGLSSMQTSAPK